MPLLLDRPVERKSWLKETPPSNGVLANGKRPMETHVADADTRQLEGWDAIIDELAAMQGLGDNWDGLGAVAPSTELLRCAVGLAYLLQQRSMDVPAAVSATTSGTVMFIWQFPSGAYGEVDLTAPFHGEVMWREPGEPTKHWVIPNA